MPVPRAVSLPPSATENETPAISTGDVALFAAPESLLRKNRWSLLVLTLHLTLHTAYGTSL